jgi:hypothetical protein
MGETCASRGGVRRTRVPWLGPPARLRGLAVRGLAVRGLAGPRLAMRGLAMRGLAGRPGPRAGA